MLTNRFWKKVNKNGPLSEYRTDLGPCWIWMAYIHPDGYGWFSINGKPRAAHIVSFESINGSVPKGLELDHLCRVRGCVNPHHLETVTRKVNMQRGADAGTFGKGNRKKTHCPRGHDYTQESIRKNGWRECRICRRELDRRRRHIYSAITLPAA